MKNDIEWLKKEIEEYLEYEGVHDARIALESVLGYIDQLDEPEKPVIPKFVADYYKDYEHLELTFEEWFEREEFEAESKTENKTFEWLLDNSHEVNIERQFILADIIAHGLDGYEVEKEPKYYVLDKEGATLLKKSSVSEGIAKSVGTTISSAKSWKDEKKYQLTEQEIKDYDERFWAFAQEVTE